MTRGVELWREFRGFALKGNMIDLALAVVIGNAFGKVVNSLVVNVITPLLDWLIMTPIRTVLPQSRGILSWHLGPIKVGEFLGDLLNFAVIAGALFLVMVKLLQALRRASILPILSEPTTKKCPRCLSDIPAKATKCSHCTADLPADITA